ncbi:hypothetical protein [Arachidicoccus terrestris]|uniref:hypothetical protein n=1 Tax=Arachidicoccus terrestris TaxID=2875539 RepID=UPI001CC76B79|nr:hypothetical protein [Arachidicoccus terrestris]UAY57004.1 hypothetical protein K9M52_08455 [Arachidicoccus terrestris]
MMRKWCFLVLSFPLCLFASAQGDFAAWNTAFQKAKKDLKGLAGQPAEAYVSTGRALEDLAVTNPGDPEVWYFLGNAIDKFNTSSGEKLPASSLALARRASDCFVNSIELSNNQYTGETILFDPHTKVLSVWGAQAERYLSAGNRDSAVWCLQQAKNYGGINASVNDYFKQVLDECTDSAYLFTNGDVYFYYITYLQLVEHYKPDVHCISLNFLNTQWYPEYLRKKGSLKLAFGEEELAKIKSRKWKPAELTIKNKAGIIGDTAISWKTTPADDSYMLRSDIILKDFLQENGFRNDVYFAADVPEQMRLYLGVDNYAELRGLTLKIVPKWRATSLPYLENRLSLLNELSIEDDGDFTYNKDNIQVLNNYRFAYTAAADLAMSQNQLKAAENILLFEEKKYPETLLPFYADATRKWFDGFKEKILMAAAAH